MLASLLSSSARDKSAKIVAAASEVSVGSVVVAVAVIPTVGESVATVQQPGIGLRGSLSLSLGGCLPLLPRLLNSGLSSGNRGGRDNSNEATVSAGHHSAGVVLASGGGGVDDGGDGVGGVGEGRADGVGKVVACGVGEGGVGLGVHGSERGSEKQELHDDGAQKMCGGRRR